MTDFESAGAAPATQFDRFARFYDADYREYDQDIEAIGALSGAPAPGGCSCRWPPPGTRSPASM
jgi:hypothetical protein